MAITWPDQLVVRPLTTADAEQIAGWRYEGRWRIYDPSPDDGPALGGADYMAVAGREGGPLVGFCCSGAEAMVPGLVAQDDILDIGVGMNPAWVGRGYGPAFGGAVLDHYRSTTTAPRMRAVVQAWNERSLRLIKSLGFVEAGEHRCEQAGQIVTYKVFVTTQASPDANSEHAAGYDGSGA